MTFPAAKLLTSSKRIQNHQGAPLNGLSYALRQLRKSPGFTATAVIVLALGIAAVTAIFAFVDATFLRPLPYRDPEHLLALYERIPVGDRYHLSYGDYLDWKRLNRSFTSLNVYRPDRFRLKTAAGGEEVAGAKISDGFFKTLGVVPFLGRDFRPGEDSSSAPETVILSYEIWQERFATSPGVLGQTVILDDQPFVIVGGTITGVRREDSAPRTELSSRPERSAVEGPAVLSFSHGR